MFSKRSVVGMIALVLALNLLGSSGFVLHRTRPNSLAARNEGLIPLAAKAAKKKKGRKPAAVSSGGFGKKSEPKEVDDYALFPALDKQVANTLIPSPPELSLEPGELPVEVYDRLDQIHGFGNFNYESAEVNGGDMMSFNELISSTRGNADQSKSSISDGDFADLLASTTVSEAETPTTKSLDEESTMDAISSLPPFTKFRVLHVDPLVLAIDDFFAEEECDRYVAMSTAPKSKDSPYQTRSKTVGKDIQAKAQRTSTTWFHHYKNVPELMAKASRLVGLKGIDQWEEPQTVRYRRNEKFTWHLDALSPEDAAPNIGGQRVATLLVYLTDLSSFEGGTTIFRDLSNSDGMLKVQPKKGTALLFFPAAGGIPNAPFDIRTLHCGETVGESSAQDKWISQLWLRESKYTPSAPPGNAHTSAKSEITDYCETYSKK